MIFVYFSFFSSHHGIIDCNCEIGVHVKSNICYLICLWHLNRPRVVTNRIFFSKYIFSLMCAQHILYHHLIKVPSLALMDLLNELYSVTLAYILSLSLFLSLIGHKTLDNCIVASGVPPLSVYLFNYLSFSFNISLCISFLSLSLSLWLYQPKEYDTPALFGVYRGLEVRRIGVRTGGRPLPRW